MYGSWLDDFWTDEEDATIDLTPLIDVVFMLLVFFIIATTFVKSQFDVDLPKASIAENIDNKENFSVVTISESGDIYFDDTLISEEKLAEAFLMRKDKILKVFADEQTPFKSVFLLMDEAKKHNHEKVIFLVEKKDHGRGNAE